MHRKQHIGSTAGRVFVHEEGDGTTSLVAFEWPPDGAAPEQHGVQESEKTW